MLERHELGGIAGERRAQEARQFVGHQLGVLVAAGDDEGGDGVQCVEQEMRIELVAERRELGQLGGRAGVDQLALLRSEEHTSELQSLMRISYAVFCLKKKRDTK